MASITTVTVGTNAQPLAAPPLAGATAAVLTVINLDTANTVNLGSSANQLALELGPLASVTLTAPIYAAAATEQLKVGVVPGGSGYSPGSLTINGPVTAEITGPVEISDIEGGTVTFTNDDIEVNGNVGVLNNVTVVSTAAAVAPGVTKQVFDQVAMPATAQSYLIEAIPVTTGAYYFATDITVSHYDASGNLMGIEEFTVSNAAFSGSSCAVRGKILGASVSVSVQTAAAAWLEAVSGIGSLNMSSVTFLLSASPFEYPGLSQTVACQNDRTLGVQDYTSTDAIGAVNYATLDNYEGSAWMSYYVYSGTANIQPIVQSYSVANGTSPLKHYWFAPTSTGANFQEIALDNRLHTIVLRTISVSAAATVYISLTPVN